MASHKHRYDMTEVDYGGAGAPHTAKRSMINLCVYGVPPATIVLDNIVAVLRRSLASVASSPSSSRRRADETLPRALLDRVFAGHHRAKHVLNAEVSYVRY